MALRLRTGDGNVDAMDARIRSTTHYWVGLGIISAFALTLIILLLTGVLGSTVWWTAAAMVLLAISNALSIRAIRRNNRRLAAARTEP